MPRVATMLNVLRVMDSWLWLICKVALWYIIIAGGLFQAWYLLPDHQPALLLLAPILFGSIIAFRVLQVLLFPEWKPLLFKDPIRLRDLKKRRL